MKKYFVLWAVILITILSAGCALAEETIPAENDRKDRVVMDGLKFVQGKEPVYDSITGVWKMTIDTEATDWKQVVAAGYTEKKEVIGLRLIIHPDPDKSLKTLPHTSSTNYVTEQELQEWLKINQGITLSVPAPGSQRVSSSYALTIGTYDAHAGKFFPREITPEESRIIFGGFSYRDGSHDSRYVKAEISFTSLDPVDAALPAVPAENIIPDFGGTNVTASVADGLVQYSNPTDNPQEMELITAVKAPGTKEQTAGWTAFIGGFPLDMSTDENGHTVALLSLELSSHSEAVSSADVIVWKDGSNVKEYQRLSLKALHGKPRPWPEYVSSLVPFDKSEMKLKLLNGMNGVSVQTDHETAIVRIAIDSKEVIRAAANGKRLTDAKLQVSLKVPKNAAYYTGGTTITAGSNIYGTDMADLYLSGSGGPTEPPVAIHDPWITLLPINYFKELSFTASNGSETTYYLAEGRSFSAPFGGAVQIISWYDAQMKLLSKNYLIYTYDDATLVTTQLALDDESDLTAPVEEPRAVIQGNWHKGRGTVMLKAERVPSSPQSHYYNLQLVDEAGNVIPVPAGEKCIVYLPYPQGHTRETAQNLVLTIGHYNSQMELQEEAFSESNGNLELTPFGMRLRVSGFSPFVVSWHAATPVIKPDVPKTGDSFPVNTLLLGMLLALSAAGWTLRKLRRV